LEIKLNSLLKFHSEDTNPVLRVSSEGIILYTNNAGSHILNLLGCHVYQILPEPWLKMVDNALHNGRTITFYGEFTLHVYSFTFTPVKEKGYVNIYGLDVTQQRKRMEQELLHAQKLQAIGVMTTGIAHELNNMLAIIDGKIQMLMQENKGRKKLLNELRLIQSSIKDGAEIVRRMNKFTTEKEDREGFVAIDLREEIKNTIDLICPKCKEHSERKGITYTINLDGVKHVSCINGNPLGLREVLINIIYNALDSMPEGGTLSFSTREENGSVVLEISDTGIGMDEETQTKIFDPFFTTKEYGMGLGMSIVYGTVNRHGGKITVQSKKGKGSTFILSFPIVKGSQGITKNYAPGKGMSDKKGG
jgi:signal transduction histidine kinase